MTEQIIVKEKETQKGKSKKGLIIKITLLVVVLAASGFATWYFLLRSPYDDKLEPNAVVGVMPGKTEEQIKDELTRKVAEKEVAFAINSVPKFDNGKAKGNILFENPKANSKLTRVEIVVDETGELIYKSGLLSPGTYVPEAKLLVDLKAGTYACTATIFAYKQEDESYIGKVAAGVSLTVEN